jgi:hypothetical protein
MSDQNTNNAHAVFSGASICCDVCGSVVGQHNTGQMTAENVVCADCLERIAHVESLKVRSAK